MSLYAIGSSRDAAVMTGIRVPLVTLSAYALAGLFAALAGLYISMVTLTGDPNIGPPYTLNSIAAVVIGGVALSGGVGSPLGAILGAFILKTISGLMFFSGLPPLAQPFFEGAILAIAIAFGALGMLRVRSRLERYALMATMLSRANPPKREAWTMDRSVLLVILACVAVVIGAGLVSPGVLSVGYLLQQLQIASIVGVLATGAMLVILLGHIDLSVPLTVTSAAILATSLAGSGNATLAALAIPAGLFSGSLIGVLNGLGVAIFRIPAMVWTLAVNAMLLGLTVFYTGGFKPHGAPPTLAVFLAHDRTLGIPNAFLVVAGDRSGDDLRAEADRVRNLCLRARPISPRAVPRGRAGRARDRRRLRARGLHVQPRRPAVGRLRQPGLSGHG